MLDFTLERKTRYHQGLNDASLSPTWPIESWPEKGRAGDVCRDCTQIRLPLALATTSQQSSSDMKALLNTNTGIVWTANTSAGFLFHSMSLLRGLKLTTLVATWWSDWVFFFYSNVFECLKTVEEWKSDQNQIKESKTILNLGKKKLYRNRQRISGATPPSPSLLHVEFITGSNIHLWSHCWPKSIQSCDESWWRGSVAPETCWLFFIVFFTK